MRYSVGIVDDNSKIAQQIAEKLLLTDEVDVLFMAEGGQEALQWLSRHKTHPGIILMDIEMPAMNGIEATFKIHNQYPDINIVMLTVFDNEDNIFNAIRAGASGYLLKDETLTRMLDAFAEVTDGGIPMSPPVARKAMQMMVEGYKPQKQLLYTEGQEELSTRELEILQLMADGCSSQGITGKLFISPATLKKHLQNIYKKLHLRSRVELVLWYQQG